MIEYKRANASQVEDVAKLCNLVFRKTETPVHNDMHLQFPLLLSNKNAKNLLVAVDGSKVVSHLGTSFTPMIIDDVEVPYGQIGAVCTHSDYRGQGLGTKLLFNSLESFKAQNVHLVTISGGRGLYRRNGAVDLGCVGEFEVSPGCFKDSYIQIDFYEGGLVGRELIDLYNTKKSRYKRTSSEFEILMNAMPVSVYRLPAQTAVARKNGKAIAYVSGNHDKANVFDAIEFAGDTNHILTLLSALADKFNAQYSKILIQNIDEGYKYFLQHSKLVNISYLPGTTFIVLDPKGLYEQVQPILEKRGFNKAYDELPLDLYCASNDGIALSKYLFDSFNIFYKGQEDHKALPLMLPQTRSYNYI